MAKVEKNSQHSINASPLLQNCQLRLDSKTHRPGGKRTNLEEHGHSSSNNTLKHSRGAEQRRNSHKLQLERVPSGRLDEAGELLRGRPLLEQRLGLDLEKLELDQLVVLGQVAQGSQVPAGLVLAAVGHQPARGEGHEGHAGEEDQRGGDLEAGRQHPGRVALLAALGAADEVRPVVDPEADHDAEGDGELLGCDEGASDFGGSDF